MSSIVSETLADPADLSQHISTRNTTRNITRNITWTAGPISARPDHLVDARSVASAAPQLVLAPNRLEIRIPIQHLDDVVKARRSGRLLARQLAYSGSRVALVLTAISELARNMLMYADGGEIVLTRTREGERDSVIVEARDTGPGIADLDGVLNSPDPDPCLGGRGLSCLRACMDRFEINSRKGVGTRVVCEVFSHPIA